MKLYKLKEIIKDDLGINNPVFVQVLGICSTLAVTNVLKNTVVMFRVYAMRGVIRN